MRTETRPWGRFEVLVEADDYWLKQIFISPGQSLSYQYHFNRSEFWIARSPGVWADIEGIEFELDFPSSMPVIILPTIKHRLFNPGPDEVAVLEWCTGRPDESDIVRLSDNYGR